MTNKENIFTLLTGGRTYTQKEAADVSSMLDSVVKHYGENSDIYNTLLGTLAGGVAGNAIGKGSLIGTGAGAAAGGSLGYLINEMISGKNTPGQKQENYSAPPSEGGLTQEGIKAGGGAIARLVGWDLPQGIHSIQRVAMPAAATTVAGFSVVPWWNKERVKAGNTIDRFNATAATKGTAPMGLWGKTRTYGGSIVEAAKQRKRRAIGAVLSLYTLYGSTLFEGRKAINALSTPAENK